MSVIYEGRKPMPRYQSGDGEQVSALKIETVRLLVGGAALVPEDDSYGIVSADLDFVETQKPEDGGYVVRGDGGRWSYSSATAFAASYTPVQTA